MSWDRKLWGVVWSNGKGVSAPITTLWMEPPPKSYPGEPPRVMTFTTREYARAWCQSAKKYQGARFSPIRIRETVTKEAT